jgi:hypothetical protein
MMEGRNPAGPDGAPSGRLSKEPTIMKSVTFSEVIRLREASPLCTATTRQLLLFGLTVAVGLPGLVVGFHLLDPAAPLGYIVGPVMAGGLLPVLAAAPGRFEVQTRFHASHLVGTLDDTLAALGYAPAQRGPGSVRYRAQRNSLRPWNRPEISVTVRDHALDIVGPFDTLRALQRQLAC